MESIPEIVTAEVPSTDETVLIRLQVPDLARLEKITEHFRSQTAVLSLEVSTSTPLLAHMPPRHPISQ